jgi:hypothetical protein
MFAGSNPAEAVGFFGRKNPQRAFPRRGRKAVGPYSYRGSRNCKLNSLGNFSPIVLPFSARGVSRHLCAERAWRRQVRPKAGWYNQLIGCSAHGGETHRPNSKGRRRRRCSLTGFNIMARWYFSVCIFVHFTRRWLACNPKHGAKNKKKKVYWYRRVDWNAIVFGPYV